MPALPNSESRKSLRGRILGRLRRRSRSLDDILDAVRDYEVSLLRPKTVFKFFRWLAKYADRQPDPPWIRRCLNGTVRFVDPSELPDSMVEEWERVRQRKKAQAFFS